LYQDLNDTDKAKAWCRNLLELQPNNAEALYRIGVIDFNISFSKTGNTGDGVKQMSEAERDKMMKIIREGIDALNQARQKDPTYANTADYLNLLYREEAKFTKDAAQKRALIQEADKLAIEALDLHKKEDVEKAKKGKGKKIA